MPLNPTPVRQRIRTFLTPRIEDFIVAQKRRTELEAIPEYETPHPDTEKYPNHLFCHAMAADEQGLIDTFLYAASREHQDDYNWDFTQADIGGSKFDAVTRTYVTLRSAFDPLLPLMGATMPDLPAETFTGTYVLAERGQRQSPDKELASIFVQDVHTYVRKVTLTDYQVDEETGLASNLVTTLYYSGELVSGVTINSLFADAANVFWSTDVYGYGREGKQLSANWFSVTYRQVVNIDTDYGVSVSKLRPDKFFCPQQTVTTEEISSNNTPGAPAVPVVTLGNAVSIQKKGRIKRVKSVVQSGSPQAVKGTSLDERTGETFVETQESVAITEVAAGEVDATGTVVLYDPADACQSVKTTRKVASTAIRTWTDIINYEWPPVLTALSFSTWPRKNNDGDAAGSAILPKTTFKRGFTGPQAATVRQWWQKAPPTIATPVQMIPEGVQYHCPYYSLSIPPCLHVSLTFTCSTGTEDPDWMNASETYTVIATNLTDWPAQIQWTESKPHRGGYIVTETTVTKPA